MSKTSRKQRTISEGGRRKPEEIQRISSLILEGVPAHAIAEEYGVSADNIRQIFKQFYLGLKRIDSARRLTNNGRRQPEAVKRIVELLDSGEMDIPKLAKLYNVSEATIRDIYRRYGARVSQSAAQEEPPRRRSSGRMRAS